MKTRVVEVDFRIWVGSCISQELASSGNFDSTIHINVVNLGLFI